MMRAVFLRRRKLGRTSCREIAGYMRNLAVVCRAGQPEPVIRHAGPVYMFRWGTTHTFFQGNQDVVCVNTPASIHWCADKKRGRLEMQVAGVPVPHTWASWGEWSDSDAFNRGSAVILRPSRHSRGRHVYVVAPGQPVPVIPWEILQDCYISHKIDKIAEYRVFVCQNRVAWVANKTPGNPDDVAWNVAQGGRFDNVRWGEWPLRVVDAALGAARVSGTDFSGVDVMVDAEGRPYVLEVNSAPSQTSEYRQRCVAECFDYIVENGKQHFDTPSIISNWKDVIHPAVRGMSDER
jgi:glutathione synthase/RimK-type ligase-like ATP-grasp enzyme